MANMMRQQPDEDVNRLGIEVERFIREDANLSTAWVRKESHFGDTKFSVFKKVG